MGGKIFCVHGGLSPKLKRPEDVNSIRRPIRISKTGDDLLTDIVWSDPNPNIEGKRFREASSYLLILPPRTGAGQRAARP